MRRRALVIAAMAALAVLPGRPAFSRVASRPAVGPATELRPNLQPLQPDDLSVVRLHDRRQIRLSNTVANPGTGPLELVPRIEDCDHNGNFDDDRAAYQRLYFDANGDGFFTRGVDTQFHEVKAGCFKFHPQHNHWHFQGYARYDLARLSDGVVVASGTKVSFCVIDTDHLFPNIPGSPGQPYFRVCEADSTEGMSIGWADTYGSYLPGQAIDITGVPAGDYCLSSIADPQGRLIETDDADNTGEVAIHLQGTVINILGNAC